MILKLSDSFEKPVEEGKFEWTATMLNINFGKNQELLERCRVLKEYAIFIDRCKSYIKTYASVAEAINKAVDECISENVLKEFLIAHRGEVLEVLLTEFDEEKYTKAIKQEGYETGFSEGRETGFSEGRETGFGEGRESGLREGYQKNVRFMVQMAMEYGEDFETAVGKVSEKLNMSIEEVKESCKEI